LLGVEAHLARKASVMRGDFVFSEPFSERVRNALDQPAGVDEYDRRAMLAAKRGDAVVNGRVKLVARDRAELEVGNLDAQVERPSVSTVDDGAARVAVFVQARAADEKAGHFVDWFLCRGKADARQRAAGHFVEPLERQRQMQAALVLGNRVDLVDA